MPFFTLTLRAAGAPAHLEFTSRLECPAAMLDQHAMSWRTRGYTVLDIAPSDAPNTLAGAVPAAKIDLSVAAEPARDDLANALQMLQLAAAGAPGTHAVTMYRADFEAVITRVRAALTKIDAQVTV